MPIYEYKCTSCGQEFETLRPRALKDEPLRCVACGKTTTRRKISVCNMRSRGSGQTGSTRLGGSSCSSCRSRSCAHCGLS